MDYNALLRAIAGYGWEVMTSFVMPGAAIFASGGLALYLQRRDHAKADKLREQEQAARRASEDDAKKRELVADTIRVHDLIARHAMGQKDLDGEMYSRWSRTPHAWQETRDPLAPFIGLWAFHQLTALLRVASDDDTDPSARVTQVYLEGIPLTSSLSGWLTGKTSTSWFAEQCLEIPEFDESYPNSRKVIEHLLRTSR